MFRIEHPEFFWLILLTAVIITSLILRKTIWKKDLSFWGSQGTVRRLSEKLTDKSRLIWLSFAGFLLLNIAAVNPQWGTKTRSIEGKTADIYILLDISNSMLAEDIAPSRLERAKRLALDLAENFKSDRIGLILFAGNAYMQSPLTTDWRAIELYLNAAHPDQAGTQGTEIGKAIRLAINAQSEDGEPSQGALVIITDGEDHDSDALNAIRDASTKGWASFVIGVGTETGSTIPMRIGNRNDVKRDETGQPVVTKLNRPLMMDLAQQGNGAYFDIAEGNAIIESLKTQFAKLERTRMEKRSFSEHKSYYQWFLMGSLVILMLIPTIRYKHDVV